MALIEGINPGCRERFDKLIEEALSKVVHCERSEAIQGGLHER